MNAFIPKKTILVFTMLALSGIGSTLFSQKLTALAVSTPITIDGDPVEWEGKLNHFEKKPFDLGVQNDSSFLYLCIRSNDPSFTLKFLSKGANVWINSKGKKKKTFGIHYPIGIGRMRHPALSGAGSENSGPLELQERLDYLKKDLDVFGPARDQRQRIIINESSGIRADLLLHGRGFVMEVRIPLYDNREWEHAIAVRRGKPLSIGIELPSKNEFKRKKRRGASHTGNPGHSDRDEMGRGRSGRQGRLNNWGETTMGTHQYGPKPFSEWFKVKWQEVVK